MRILILFVNGWINIKVKEKGVTNHLHLSWKWTNTLRYCKKYIHLPCQFQYPKTKIDKRQTNWQLHKSDRLEYPSTPILESYDEYDEFEMEDEHKEDLLTDIAFTTWGEDVLVEDEEHDNEVTDQEFEPPIIEYLWEVASSKVEEGVLEDNIAPYVSTLDETILSLPEKYGSQDSEEFFDMEKERKIKEDGVESHSPCMLT